MLAFSEYIQALHVVAGLIFLLFLLSSFVLLVEDVLNLFRKDDHGKDRQEVGLSAKAQSSKRQ